MKKVVRNWYLLLLLAFLGWAGVFYYLIKKETPVVIAPFEKVNVPYETFEIVGEEGGEFISQRGTKIVIPAKAFVDKSGELINERVLIKYRQLDNAADIFLSGLPMNYDSTGERLLETAEVIEIKAFVRNQPVFLSSGSKIDLKYTAPAPLTSDYGVYHFDTLNLVWQYSDDYSAEKLPAFEVGNQKYLSKVRLRKEDLFLFDLEIDQNDYPELKEFKDLKWAYIGDNDKIDPRKNSWAFKILWTKTQLKLIDKKSKVYQLVLSNNEGRSFKTLITPFREELLQNREEYIVVEKGKVNKALKTEETSINYQLSINQTGAWNIARKRLKEEEQIYLSTLKFSNPSLRISENDVYLLDMKFNTVRKISGKAAQKVPIKPSSELIVISVDDDNQFSFDKVSEVKSAPVTGVLEFYLMQCEETIKSYNHFHKLLTM
ncbi:MAG: hypothetical protein J7604_01300 [Sporocytophaga sp.]|uniref:hypothetical protein n=1 Tax=Sporocytophaga sp. TaxID=2231183 RepID=UPI001B18173C|nr:hypothetical protein [Sporocytophaga sp.]MBO9698809.1 hypothetical protein [Sporocytophaga sp.]